MGFFRGSIVIFLYTLLFVSFLGLSLVLTLSSSLEYNSVKDKIIPLVYSLGDENSIVSKSIGINEINFSSATDDAIKKMKTHCVNYTDYVFDYRGSSVAVSCATLQEGGKEAILNETINSFVESTYYQKYDCGFWKCFDKGDLPLFLVSQTAKDYWQNKFYFFLLSSLVLLAIIFLFSENRLNTPIVAGIFLSLSALPLLKISAFLSKILGPPTSLFLDIFFGEAGMVFWVLFLIGLALIGIGVALEVLNLDFVKHLIEKKDDLRGAISSAKDSIMPQKKPTGKKKKK